MDEEQIKALARPFMQFVERAWGMIEMRPAPEVEITLLLTQLHQATKGVVGYVMSLLEHTTENAREGKRDQLLLSDFARAFDEHLRGHLLDLKLPGAVLVNPFVDDEGRNDD